MEAQQKEREGTVEAVVRPDPLDKQVSMSLRAVLFLGGVWPVVCALVVFMAMKGQTDRLAAELAARPAIAVLPVDQMLNNFVESTRGEAPIEEGMAEVTQTATQLAQSGYVVLDASNVYAYPEEFEVAR